MEIRHLQTFLAVADLLSFTKASGKLNLAQSSVSAQIKQLESDLGVKLFDRIGKRVFLTDAGVKLKGYARRIDSMSEEIRAELLGEEYRGGSLTIRVPETIASVYIPAILQEFTAAFPQVKLSFINCSDLHLREELSSGRIDLAFLLTDHIHGKDMNVRYLRQEKLSFLVSPEHPFRNKGAVSLASLSQETLLLPRTD